MNSFAIPSFQLLFIVFFLVAQIALLFIIIYAMAKHSTERVLYKL